MKLEKANIAMGLAGGTPWQRTYTPEQVARLHFGHIKNLTERRNEARPCERAMRTACEHGELVHVAETIPGKTARRSYNEFTRDYDTIPATPDRKLLHIEASAAAAWFAAQGEAPGELLKAWFAAQGVGVAVATPAPAETVPAKKEAAEERQDRRLKMCIDDGLKMDRAALRRMPDGIGKVADREGVSRQTLTDDVKAALKRKYPETRPKLMQAK